MTYFPDFSRTKIPEEVFFEILKHLHPGAIWLFCRHVSRDWKVHIDSNVERYYKYYYLTPKSERSKFKGMVQFGHYQQSASEEPESDSLCVSIKWDLNFSGRGNLSYLLLKVRGIETLEGRKSKVLTTNEWDENVVFTSEQEVPVFGAWMYIYEIRHLMFPGFERNKRVLMSPFEARELFKRLRTGSHTIKIGDYQVQFTLGGPIAGVKTITIETVSIPFRTLMLCLTRHIVCATRIFSKSDVDLQLSLPLIRKVATEVISSNDNSPSSYDSESKECVFDIEVLHRPLRRSPEGYNANRPAAPQTIEV